MSGTDEARARDPYDPGLTAMLEGRTFTEADLLILEYVDHPMAVILISHTDKQFPLAQLWANRAWLRLWNKRDLDEFRAVRGEDWSESRAISMRQIQSTIDAGGDAWQQPVLHVRGKPQKVSLHFQPIQYDIGGGQGVKTACFIDKVPDDANTSLGNTTLYAKEGFRYAPVSVSMFAPDGSVVAENPQAQQMRTDHEQAAGRGTDKWREDVFGGDGALVAEMQSAMDDGRPFHTTVCRRDRWYEVEATPAKDPVRGGDMVVVSQTNVTRIKQLEREMLEVQQQAWANREKERQTMFAGVTHELRTPLNGIIGLSTALIEEVRLLWDHTPAICTLPSPALHPPQPRVISSPAAKALV